MVGQPPTRSSSPLTVGISVEVTQDGDRTFEDALYFGGGASTGLLAAAPDEVADNDAKPDRKNKRGGEIVFHGFLRLLRCV